MIGHHIGQSGKPFGRDGAGAQARLDIRMRFVDQHRLRVRGARGLQQAKVGFHLTRAQPDRGVILDLPRDQDAVPRRLGWAGRRRTGCIC